MGRMPSRPATKSIVSRLNQPSSSCAIRKAAITAERRHAGGYFAHSRSMASSAPGERSDFITATIALPVNLAKHDVLRADDRHDIRDHMPANHLIERREMREARRANLD